MAIAVSVASATVTVSAGDEVAIKPQNFTLYAKEILCAFIEGTVTCETTAGTPVEGAIVRVEGGDLTEPLFGITNANGFYSVCVPVPETDPVDYTVTVHCSSEDLCEDAACSGCPLEG